VAMLLALRGSAIRTPFDTCGVGVFQGLFLESSVRDALLSPMRLELDLQRKLGRSRAANLIQGTESSSTRIASTQGLSKHLS
jgi:hypothetical protein